MNPQRFFIPNMYNMRMPLSSMMRMGSTGSRGIGLFNRLGINFKNFSFSGLLNGANKTLNVVNQTIPLVRQAKPMVNNVRSMLKLARAFGNETISKNNANNIENNKMSNNINITNTNSNGKEIIDNNVNNYYDNYPNFFI